MNKQLFDINIKSILLTVCLLFVNSLGVFAIEVNDAFPPITFNVGSISGEVGETVCVDVTVENFIRVESIQFSINYNSTLLSIVCPPDITNSPLDQSELAFNCVSELGTVGVIWSDPNSLEGDGVSLDNGTTIFTLCFEIIGTCGLSSPIIVNSDIVELEVVQIREDAVICVNENINLIDGLINIICPEMTINAVKCNAFSTNNDGTLSFFVAGGSGDYSYTVSPDGFTGNTEESERIEITGLSSGDYTITATDNVSGEVIIETVSITDEGSIEIMLDATDPYCFNKDRGQIETTTTNSFGDVIFANLLNYEWSNFRFTEDIDDLGSGTYSVTVTDLNGCSATETATLFVEPLILHAEVLDSASCEGNDDAIVKIWAEGGTPFPPMPNPEYEFETDAGDTSQPVDTLFLNNVESGEFNFAVIDAAIPLCTVDSIIDIPFKGIDLAIDIDTTNISCFGEEDGSATITASGSTNFSIQVRDENNMLLPGGSFPTMRTVEDLSAGCYTVTVIESFNGCEITGVFCIEEPELFELTIDEENNPGCVGNDGSILLTATGGTMPYSYEWSDGPSTDEDRTGLIGGMYEVTVTDASGCSNTASFDLPDGADVQIEANVIQAINCPQDQNGIIEVVVSTGGNFAYNWETPDGTFVSDMQTVSNLSSGIYYVTATDAAAMCTALDTVILAPASPIIVQGDFTEPSCAGTPNGSIGIVHLEGTAPFSYNWETGGTQQVLSGISDGTYNVTVTDANMCELDTFLTLSAPPAIEVDFTDIVGVNCFGGSDGSITATASGGPEMAGTYSFFWSNDPTTTQTGLSSSQSGFPAGENWVIAADFSCISDTMFFTIPDIDSISIDLDNSVFTSPSCFGDCDGSIEVVATGGNPAAYNYTWSDDGSTNPIRTGLCAGVYNVEIEDANGCIVNRDIELLEPIPLSVALDSIRLQEISCNVPNSGSIGVLAEGGSMPYTYEWTDNVSTEDIATELFEGTYNIEVTDDNGCTASTSITLTAPEPLVAIIGDIEEPNCFGEPTCISFESVTGGVGSNYTYQINNGPRIPVDSCFSVFANDYTINVFDGTNSCSDELFISIDQPDPISVDAGPDQEIDLGSESEVISPTIDSSLPIVDVIWSPIDSLQCIDAACEDVISNTLNDILYTVTVVDQNGCTADDDIFITVNTSRNVYIPNIFTPNGDGENDYFNLVIGSGAVSVSFLSIFDRWGNRVFAIENEYIPEVGMQDGWDGKHNGNFVNPGVYVYTAQVNFLDGKVLTYSGDLTVIR